MTLERRPTARAASAALILSALAVALAGVSVPLVLRGVPLGVLPFCASWALLALLGWRAPSSKAPPAAFLVTVAMGIALALLLLAR